MKKALGVVVAFLAFAGCESLNGGPAPERAAVVDTRPGATQTPAMAEGTGGSGDVGQDPEGVVSAQQLLQTKNAFGAAGAQLGR